MYFRQFVAVLWTCVAFRYHGASWKESKADPTLYQQLEVGSRVRNLVHLLAFNPGVKLQGSHRLRCKSTVPRASRFISRHNLRCTRVLNSVGKSNELQSSTTRSISINSSDRYFEMIVPKKIAPGTPLPRVLAAIAPEQFPTVSVATQRLASKLEEFDLKVNGLECNGNTTAGSGDRISWRSPHRHLTSWLRNGTKLGYVVYHEFMVPASVESNTSLPRMLLGVVPQYFPTGSKARRACRNEEVLVNGVVSNCSRTVDIGDVIELQSRQAPGYSPRGKPGIKIDVVYEDDEIAVVYKPPGVLTHPTGKKSKYKIPTMTREIRFALSPPPPGTIGALDGPVPCHRLDKLTSGLMVCAKTYHSANAMSDKFEKGLVQKQYRAIVGGRIKGNRGEIDSPIDGRPSQTKWRVLSRSRTRRLGGGHLTELALFPGTGRGHQLRIHCAEVLGSPILGDSIYGEEDANRGMFLSAVEIAFTHPRSDPSSPDAEAMHFRIDVPEKFETFIQRQDRAWRRELPLWRRSFISIWRRLRLRAICN